MNLRSREVYIITGVIIVVVLAAWFFLLFKPLSNNVKSTNASIDQTRLALTAAQAEVVTLEGFRKTAPQTQSDLLRLNKMMPSQSGIPSVIVEITQTAQDAGLEFVRIDPEGVTPGSPFSVQTIGLTFNGVYDDLWPFLMKLEDYVTPPTGAFTSFTVSGRLLQVAQIKIGEGPTPGFPNISITLTINAFLCNSPQVYTGSVEPAPEVTPTASPSASPSPTVSPSGSTSPTPTTSPSP